MAEVELYEGRGEAALARVERGWGSLSGSLLLRAQYFRLLALHLKARCALGAAGRSREARLAEASKMASRLDREGTALSREFARTVRGAVLAARGEVGRAAGLFAEAQRGFEAAGMTFHAALSRRRLGELSGDRGLVSAADELLRGQKIKDPERVAAAYMPLAPP
jgi:hypothetical protein